MKKKIICSVAFLAAIIGVSATVTWTGECGAEVTTADERYFESEEKADEYYRELNEIFCGTEKGGEYTIRR